MKNGNNGIKSLQDRIKAMQNQNPILKAKLDAVKTINAQKIKQIQSQTPTYFVPQQEPTASTIHKPNNNSLGANGMNNYSHPFKYLVQQKQMLQNQLKNLSKQMDNEHHLLKNAEAKMKGGLVPNEGPMTMQHNLAQALNKDLMPGNLGDINRVVWPFWFTTTEVVLEPNTSAQGNITITQEAAFIWLSYTKAVFLEDVGNAGNFEFIDPAQPDAAGKSNNLTFSLRDSQSSRTFMNKAIDINQIGFYKYPTVLPTPQLMLPNSNTEFTFQNNDSTNVYKPFITMFGLRVRIDHAKDVLDTISA